MAPKPTEGRWETRAMGVVVDEYGRNVASTGVGKAGPVEWAAQTFGEAKANAFVLAASKDLLAACEAINVLYIHAFDESSGGLIIPPSSVNKFEAAFKAIEAAISKARPQSPEGA